MFVAYRWGVGPTALEINASRGSSYCPCPGWKRCVGRISAAIVPPPEAQRAPYGSDVPRTRTSGGRVLARCARGPPPSAVPPPLLTVVVAAVPLKEGEVTTTVPKGNADDGEDDDDEEERAMMVVDNANYYLDELLSTRLVPPTCRTAWAIHTLLKALWAPPMPYVYVSPKMRTVPVRELGSQFAN